MNLPNIPVEAVEGFSKIWKSPAGLTLILDAATKQFALDFARVTLRSFIMQNAAAAQALAKEKEKAAAAAPTKSSIVLTD